MELNTSYPLYGNLKFLVGVNEFSQLVDLVFPQRTFSPHPSASFGSGAYGRHFGSRSSSRGVYGASFSPNFQPEANTGTLVVVTNSVMLASASYPSHAAFVNSGNAVSSALYLPRLGNTAANTGVAASVRSSSVGNQISQVSATPLVADVPRMWTFARDSTTSHAIFVDGSLEVSGGELGTDSGGGYWAYLGGTPGYARLDADMVWIAWFDKSLSADEVAELYSSLGADNRFGLIQDAGPVPISFNGLVPDQLGTKGIAFGLDIANHFSGTELPFTYSLPSGTLPSGLTLNGVTGYINGTPTTAEGQAGIVIRGSDLTADSADSNAFSITINDAPADNTTPTFVGPIIADIGTREGVAISLDVSGRFSDVESALGFSVLGTWPLGITLSSAGVIGGAPSAAGTYAGLRVRATDSGSLTADSNEFTIVVELPLPSSTIAVSEPLKNNTGLVRANESGVRIAVLRVMDLVSVHAQTGLTTDGSGRLAAITSPLIVSGQHYHVVIKTADGGVGITDPVAAS